jgi:SAM-dependent methyltransferase
MILDVFRYDFGYAGWLTRGHLFVFVVAGALALLAWWRGAPSWLLGLATLGAAWALAGALIIHGPLEISRPLTTPSPRFLAGGAGHVIDLGAGSGRAGIGLLRGRPRARVTALDLYSGYYGITDNTPERLLANAAVAGVRDRIDVRTGDMTRLPFTDASFDGAISSFAIDHLPPAGRDAALRETARVLRPGGELLLIIVNIDGWIRVALPALPGHGYFGRQPSSELWRGALRKAGFTLVEEGTAPGLSYYLARTAPQ